ncbi:hypothetical protein KBX37_33295 [Micromonospora sp. U56]|uniref:hypothetical protein n=1 Tax=Micromonospora sp. U56 TaxID=2824900 RepID=UPI001B396205|nr:hypothetical protein [Micromonospora sp. U56]MBQ0897865.1 hypothetical protein [Micromonospora sp. U56]
MPQVVEVEVGQANRRHGRPPVAGALEVGAAQDRAGRASEDERVLVLIDEVVQVCAHLAADRRRNGDGPKAGIGLGRAESQGAVLALDQSRADHQGPQHSQ